MKRIRRSFAQLAVTAAVLFCCCGWRPGDPAAALTHVRWLSGAPLMPAVERDAPPSGPSLRVVVFMLTRAPDSVTTVQRLNALAAQWRERIQIAVVTPDPELDARNFLAKVRGISIGFGVDTQRRVTAQYMAGNLYYPMAFAIDDNAKIIWCGECTDFDEMAGNFFAGRFDKTNQRQIADLIDKLHVEISASNERIIRKLVSDIFALDPENPAALRIRLFLLENSNRNAEAWKLIRERIAATPKLARLYFTAIDFIARHAEYRGELESVIREIETNFPEPLTRSLAALTLLNYFPYDFIALRGAHTLLKGVNPPQDRSVLAATCHAARALYAYRVGNLAAAIREQQAAVAVWRERRDKRATADAEAREEFFRVAAELGKQK